MIIGLIPSWLITLVLALTDPFLRGLPDVEWTSPDTSSLVGRASQYGGPKDSRWGGQALACAPDFHVTPSMNVCAHRTFKCGTILLIEAVTSGERAACVVMDRGPFGACTVPLNAKGRCPKGKWRVEIKLQPGSVRMGELDLTPGVFADLSVKRGRPQVRFWRLYVPQKAVKIRPKQRPRAGV